MIPAQCEVVEPLLREYKPTSIMEIGCHKGITARWMCSIALEYRNRLHYKGYDAFEEVPTEEWNGKSVPDKEKIIAKLNRLRRQYKNFTYDIVEGYTQQTLTSPIRYSFVYIDGGHSYATVKHDYSMVKDSKIILFDDYNLPGVQEAINEIGKGKELELTHRKKRMWLIVND
jgi:hypothetical protein